MADYSQPETVEKRVRFFDGQFLVDQDFVDEQKYHLDRERRLSKLLRVTGVADGLKVSATKANQIKVTKGVAVDSLGRQLALADDRTIDLLPAAKFNNQQAVSLYILYQETAVDLATTGSKSERRWLEKPQIVAAITGGESTEPWDNQAIPVLLARLNLDNNGTVTVDGSATQYAGLNLPGNVGIGTTEPAAKLHISGGRLQLDGNQQIKFTDTDTTNNLKLQLWSGYGLGINGGTLFYAADGKHSWRDINGANERMALTTGADGGLTVMGTGLSSFAGNLGIGTASPENADGWNRVLDLLGSGRAKLSVRTATIDARILAHDAGWWNAPAGMIVGTQTNHPLTFGTSAAARMTIDTAGHVGIGTLSPAANLDVAGVVKAASFIGDGAVPKGVIVMWSGAINMIPNGWTLCNGQNGTPNLTDRFVVAAGVSYAVNAKGGDASHAHAVDIGSPQTSREAGGPVATGGGPQYPFAYPHSHTVAIGMKSSNAVSNLPPYFALAYIMKL